MMPTNQCSPLRISLCRNQMSFQFYAKCNAFVVHLLASEWVSVCAAQKYYNFFFRPFLCYIGCCQLHIFELIEHFLCTLVLSAMHSTNQTWNDFSLWMAFSAKSNFHSRPFHWYRAANFDWSIPLKSINKTELRPEYFHENKNRTTSRVKKNYL